MMGWKDSIFVLGDFHTAPTRGRREGCVWFKGLHPSSWKTSHSKFYPVSWTLISIFLGSGRGKYFMDYREPWSLEGGSWILGSLHLKYSKLLRIMKVLFSFYLGIILEFPGNAIYSIDKLKVRNVCLNKTFSISLIIWYLEQQQHFVLKQSQIVMGVLH